MKTTLTIAGSDSGGGAGVQADLKTFAALGVYGTSAFTALTAQNSRGVAGVHQVPPEFVTLQIETVVTDFGCDAVKTGMLSTAPTVEAVAAVVEALDLPNLVVDPVMVAKSGDRLLDDDAVHAVRASLLPRARVVTPNVPEAEVLSGVSIRTLADVRAAAERLLRLGPACVVIKGGHLDTPDVIDVFVDRDDYVEVVGPRVAGRHTHGTGCTFSAALAAWLAQGMSPLDAVRRSKEFVTSAMRRGIPLGGGHRPLDHLFVLREGASG